MRSIARILPVLVFAGRVALASPIVVGRDNPVVCTYKTAEGDTGNITQRDISAFLAGKQTHIPKAALADCCSKTQGDSGQGGGSLGAHGHGHLDETTPPPAASSMKDGATAGKSSNDDVQLDESTDSKPSPSQDVKAHSQDQDSNSPPHSSGNSQNADVKVDDKAKPSKTEGVDGEVDSSLHNPQTADVKVDDETKPSKTEGVDGQVDPSLHSSGNSQNANVKVDDKTKPCDEGVDGQVDPSKTHNSQNADVKVDDKTKPCDEAVDGEVDPSKSHNSQTADIKADDKTKPCDEGVDGQVDLVDEASKLAEGGTREQVKGNEAPTAMEDCPCRYA